VEKKEKRSIGGETLASTTSSQTEDFDIFKVKGIISSSLGFIIFLWGCKDVRV